MKYPVATNSPRRQMWCQACGAQIRAYQLPQHAQTCRGLSRHRAELNDRENERPESGATEQQIGFDGMEGL